MNNPLMRPILEMLSKATGPIKEYELHSQLDSQAFEAFIKDCSDDVALFRKHFLVMNALYELHEELSSQGVWVHISALDIHLQYPSKSQGNALTTDSGFKKLSEYYRDWKNFVDTDEQEVERLLNQFWDRYLGFDEYEQSLLTLGLDKSVTWNDIRQQYRKLCHEHHPDKGGDALKFIKIRQAYENLKRINVS